MRKIASDCAYLIALTGCSEQIHRINNTIINPILPCFNESHKEFYDIFITGCSLKSVNKDLGGFSQARFCSH